MNIASFLWQLTILLNRSNFFCKHDDGLGSAFMKNNIMCQYGMRQAIKIDNVNNLNSDFWKIYVINLTLRT